MSHAHHFLSRLDRVSVPHVELALMLYHDPRLLRFIFERAHISTQVERVALSLEDPDDGPFLIVTRDGKFVTCLAKGMKAGNWPTITRGQLDAIAAKMGEMRERMNAAIKLTNDRGGRTLLRRVYDAGDALPREDFIAISALQPLMAPLFHHLYAFAACDLEDSRDILIPMLRKTDKLKPYYDEALHSYWQTLWALGNFAILMSMDGAEHLPEDTLQSMSKPTKLSWPALRQGIFSIGLRGVWAAGRIGKLVLPPFKIRAREVVSRMQHLDATSCLLAIGTRHNRLRAEVEKALASDISDKIKGTAEGEMAFKLRQAALKFNDLEGGTLESQLEFQKGIGEVLVKFLREHSSSPYVRFQIPEDLPNETTLLLAANSNWSYLEQAPNSAMTIVWFMAMVPWMARLAPEDFFLPRETLRAHHIPWTPEVTLNVLRAMRDHNRPQRNSVPQGPTRKGPCPCGSGKKYKRCCGTEAEP